MSASKLPSARFIVDVDKLDGSVDKEAPDDQVPSHIASRAPCEPTSSTFSETLSELITFRRLRTSEVVIKGWQLALWPRVCISGFIVAVTGGTVLPMMFMDPSPNLYPTSPCFAYEACKFRVYGATAIAAALSAVVVLIHASTTHLQLVGAYIVFIWLQIWSRSIQFGIITIAGPHKYVTWLLVFEGCFTSCWGIAGVLGCVIIRFRISALRASSLADGQQPSTSKARATVSVSSISLVLLGVGLALYGLANVACDVVRNTVIDPDDMLAWHWLLLGTLGLVAGSYLTFAGASCSHFFRAYLVSVRLAAIAEGRIRDDAVLARRTALFQLIGTCLFFFLNMVSFLAYVSMNTLKLQLHALPMLENTGNNNGVLRYGNIVIKAYTDMFLALTMSGAFSGSLVAAFAEQRSEHRRRLVYARMASGTMPCADADWSNTLERLANRGFTLQALLDFYKGLGTEYMPHFNSGLHTTAAVVRHAIIPLSREKGVAYASIMMDGEPTRPEKMVTHNWRNKFKHLVAAIVADALGEREYAMISYLMDHDIERLERWVVAVGKHVATYWVCAFSVNQHATICGSCRSRDDVTGLQYPTCDCGRPKVLNDTPPCYNGKSIDCEVNKFDDFMTLMASTTPDFQQVVAVDADFSLFSRAWCVAELAAADRMGMRQRLKVYSHSTLDEHMGELEGLRIEDMDASREEDKEEILSKIDDKEAFNRGLRSLIVERLFPKWNRMDSEEQMLRIGSLVRWYTVSKSESLDGIWAESIHPTLS